MFWVQDSWRGSWNSMIMIIIIIILDFWITEQTNKCNTSYDRSIITTLLDASWNYSLVKNPIFFIYSPRAVLIKISVFKAVPFLRFSSKVLHICCTTRDQQRYERALGKLSRSVFGAAKIFESTISSFHWLMPKKHASSALGIYDNFFLSFCKSDFCSATLAKCNWLRSNSEAKKYHVLTFLNIYYLSAH